MRAKSTKQIILSKMKFKQTYFLPRGKIPAQEGI